MTPLNDASAPGPELGGAGELHALVIELHPEGAVELPATHGQHAHALFFRWLAEVDPALAARLHDSGERKPFTVSSLAGAARRPGGPGARLVAAGPAPLRLRLTILDAALFARLRARFLRPGADPGVRIGGARFQVGAVLNTAAASPWAGVATCAELWAAARADATFALEWASPTAFSLGGRRYGVVPLPELVVYSWWKRWNALAPPTLQFERALVDWAREHLVLSGYALRTAMFDFGRHKQVGFLGRCAYAAVGEPLPAERLRAVQALAAFAFYAGTGHKTTMGMGQTRPLPLSAPGPSGRGGAGGRSGA